MSYQFMMPHKSFFGLNALGMAENTIKSLGKKALIVTGKIVTKTGLVKKLTDYLDGWGIEYTIFNDIPGEPTDEMIRVGVEVYNQAKCDFLIGIGGGSPLDSAKAIAVSVTLDTEFSELVGTNIVGVFPPTVMIPTTSGTGSEATKFFVITDSKTDVKMLLMGEGILPTVAIVDYTFTLTAPPSITASTGMDALTHAVEAFISQKGNAMTDVYARSAIKRIFEYLPAAWKDGDDKKAREEMSLAAYEAGVCINNSSVTLVHGMSRPIGAIFHVPHGISNAMLIKTCLNFALDGCYDKFAELAKLIGAADDTDGEKNAAQGFIRALTELCRSIQIPTLKEYGIDQKEFERAIPKMAEDALASGSPANTIKPVSKENIMTIYKYLWNKL